MAQSAQSSHGGCTINFGRRMGGALRPAGCVLVGRYSAVYLQALAGRLVMFWRCSRRFDGNEPQKSAIEGLLIE